MLNTTKVITAFGKDYPIDYPNVGQTIKIERLKMSLSSDEFGESRYADMAKSGLKTQAQALDLIDAIAHLSTMIPALQDDAKIGSYLQMDRFKAKELVKIFLEQYFPWYKQISDSLDKFGEDADNTSK